jgi:hypothetical protein
MLSGVGEVTLRLKSSGQTDARKIVAIEQQATIQAIRCSFAEACQWLGFAGQDTFLAG